jgi:sec-independent protein translocase protein TatC
MARNAQPDADDLFADTRMSFGDHIEDLRTHLMRAIIGFVVAMVLSFTFSSYVLDFIQKPVVKALNEFKEREFEKNLKEAQNGVGPAALEANQPQEFPFQVNKKALLEAIVEGLKPEPGVPDPKPNQELRKQLEQGIAKIPPDEWVPLPLRVNPLQQAVQLRKINNLLVKQDRLIVLGITEGMLVWLKVSMLCGVILGSPWIFFQLWSFVAAGLYSNEKKLVHVYMPFSLALFLTGVFLAEFVVIPQAVRFLLEFDEWLGVSPELRLEDWLSFALMMPLVFGISFQTPLIMLFLAKIGIFDAAAFRSKRRVAWFIIIVAAALVMPTTDPYTIFMMQVPLIGLYEFGILLAAYVDRQRAAEQVEDPDEMVGV